MTSPTHQNPDAGWDGCPFCGRIQRGEFEETTSRHVVRFSPLNPVTPGHMLFVPRGHIRDVAALDQAIGHVFAAAAAYGTVWGSFNLILSRGEPATQTVEHAHVHFVPRRPGDGLTLPWTGQVKA